jgi:hypothetical protein
VEAQYDLAVSLASSRTLTVQLPIAPQFDVDDVVAVTNPRQGLAAQPFIVDTLSVDLSPGAPTSLAGRVIVAGS